MSPSTRLFLALASVYLVLYVPWLRVEPAHIGLESTRILVAREMQRNGDWIVPTQNGETYLAKPPLWNWMIALGSVPFGGISVFSARLISSVCTFLLALSAALFARRELGPRQGLLAGLAVLSSGIVLEKGMRAELESPLALFTGLAILALFQAAWCEPRRGRWTLAAGIALGAAILVKGPVALVVFALALAGLAFGASTRRRAALTAGGGAILVSLLASGAWLAAVFARSDPASSWRTLVYEIFKRLHDPGAGNREAFWYYAPALVASFAPASLLLPALASRESPAARESERQRSLYGLLVGWSVLTLVALSFSAAKEARYLIATIPGWALLASWAWFRADAAPWLERYRRLLVRAGFALTWVLPPAVAIAGWTLRRQAWPAFSIAAALVLVAAVLGHLARVRARPALGWAALLVGIVGLRVFWAGVPMARKAEQFPIEALSQEIAARLAPGEPLVQLGEYASDVQLLVDHPFRMAPTVAEIRAALAATPRARYVLVRARDLDAGQAGDLVEVATWPFGSTRYRLLRAP